MLVSYPSQSTYEYGSCMCTTAAMYWGCACVAGILAPQCSPERMQILMQTASDTQRAITQAMYTHTATMLQQHQVLSHIRMPPDVACVEVYGYCMPYREDLRDFVNVSEIFDMIKNKEALVITGGGHSTSLYRDDTGLLFAYDSAPAMVMHVSSQAELTNTIKNMHGSMSEFTGTFIRRVPCRVSRL